MTKTTKNTPNRNSIIFNFFSDGPLKITEAEVDYFARHPDEIDEISAASNIHRVFLFLGVVIGLVFVAVSKLIAASELEIAIGDFGEDFFVDIVFESGVALIGAALTAYFLGILLKSNQAKARRWRSEIRRRIRERNDTSS